MRGLAVVAVSAVLLTGCGSAATSPVTIETSSNSMAEVVGVTIIPADEREQSIVISGETADGSELSTSTYAGDIVVVMSLIHI